VLKPAATNPWYVLATLAREQTKIYDQKLHDKNREFWNAWLTQNLTDEARDATKDTEGRAYLKFQKNRKWEDLKVEAERLFHARLPGANIPDPEIGADFSNLEFGSFVSFQEFWFNSANFSGCNFSQDVYFVNSTWSGGPQFIGTTFCSVANFIGAQFLGAVIFYQAVFCKRSTFRSTIFAGHSDFRDTIFDEPCNMRVAKFLTEYPNLDGAALHNKTNVTAKNEYWPSIINEEDEYAVTCCATLRQNMTAQGRSDDAHFFFRREMDHKAEMAKIWERPFYDLYQWAEYGFGVRQPLELLLWVWLLGWLLLWTAETLTWYDALFLSLANIFKFLGFQKVYFDNTIKDLCGALKVLTALQTAVGYLALFFLGLGLRNRFRLK